MDTRLRSDYERRAPLVEIDALAALMLGLSADHLALMFRAQFPVLRKYENEKYFENAGRKMAKDHHAQGVKQGKNDYKLPQAYPRVKPSVTCCTDTSPIRTAERTRLWVFFRPDREAEMRAAYAEVARRLRL